jgi:hypothetical protein
MSLVNFSNYHTLTRCFVPHRHNLDVNIKQVIWLDILLRCDCWDQDYLKINTQQIYFAEPEQDEIFYFMYAKVKPAIMLEQS